MGASSSKSRHGSANRVDGDKKKHKGKKDGRPWSTPTSQDRSSHVTERPASSVNSSPSKELSASPNRTTIPASNDTVKDVMISYSHQDCEFMRRIQTGLETKGLTVWVDEVNLGAGVEFLSKIGKAIVDSRCFLTILSPNSVGSHYCKDELALAYVSSKPIFPVALASQDKLFPLMDFGQKLTLSAMNWVYFENGAEFSESFGNLAAEIRRRLVELDSPDTEIATGAPTESRETSRNDSPKRGPRNRNIQRWLSESSEKENFWTSNFAEKLDVPWKSFVASFIATYNSEIDGIISKAEDRGFITDILHRELAVPDETGEIVMREAFDHMCSYSTGEESGKESRSFWLAVRAKVIEYSAIREVFEMESTVRIDAIENLGKFRSSNVREALLDLLRNDDANCRAVAAIALARSGIPGNARSTQQIVRLLSDKDRLVRESACLALGHIHATSAVPRLVSLWRNDVISSVRDAALLALEEIGGDEANKAIHVTKVLAQEIGKLTRPSDTRL